MLVDHWPQLAGSVYERGHSDCRSSSVDVSSDRIFLMTLIGSSLGPLPKPRRGSLSVYPVELNVKPNEIEIVLVVGAVNMVNDAYRNGLLAALPPEAIASLARRLERFDFLAADVIYTSGMPIRAVLFIELGVAIKVVRFASGEIAEVGIVGREGLLGLPLVLGTDADVNDTIAQCSGYAFSIDSTHFIAEVTRNAPLRGVLLRYAMAFQAQISRTAACNGRHTLEQRFARWLLMLHDRAESEVLPVTHDIISAMLGVRRSGVTVAAGAIQSQGFIHLERGRVKILDRRGLEQIACECYRATRDEYDRLITKARV